MIMKTHSEKAIKSLLTQLFDRNRENKWNSYDTTIAISYLIQRNFEHMDLLVILSKQRPKLYNYYYHNCKSSFLDCFIPKRVNKLGEIISTDSKAHYLYFMYLCEIKRKNYMAAFAYFKNFFDRVTADFDFAYNSSQMKRPNYNNFYREGAFVTFYSGIVDSEKVIKKAHKLRNANPLSHSSSELLDNESTTYYLKQSIKDLTSIIFKFIGNQIQ